MTKAVARWSGHKVKFEVEAESGHRAVIDEPPVFGDDEGMRPTEMLLGALGGCTGVNAVLLLKKFKQPYRSLAVEVEGDQEPDWPHRFLEVRITFAIEWDGPFDADLVDKALDMACNRYCPVDATLTHGTRIAHSRRDV
jgi:putative redox protein